MTFFKPVRCAGFFMREPRLQTRHSSLSLQINVEEKSGPLSSRVADARFPP